MGDPSPQGAAYPAPNANDKILFWASFLTLIAAGIGFSVRGAILVDWGNQFGFTQSELGTITGGGLAGFGLAIIFFSFCADLFGYGKLMLVAFLLHLASAVLTFAATAVYASYGKDAAFNCLSYGMLLFALGNGTCEAVINPLTATLFPRNKTHWLNILHAGWPLGLILGALIVLGFEQFGGAGLDWRLKLGVFLLPVFLYGILMFNRPFPRSEASAAGLSLSDMMGTVGMLGMAVAAGLFGLFLSGKLPGLAASVGVTLPYWAPWAIAGAVWLIYSAFTRFAPGSLVIAVLYVLHALVGYVELGTDGWIVNITAVVLKNGTFALLASIWTNLLMTILRFFAGPIVHRINPIGLLLISAILGTTGLYLMGQPGVNTIWWWLGAATVYALGKTFYWPTLLGVVSERFPRGGALALGVSGGIGMLSAGLLGTPGIGYKQDYFAVQKLQELSPEAYDRYQSRDAAGKPAPTDFPVVTKVAPDLAPPVAGLDNGKLKVFGDYAGYLGKVEEAKKTNQPAPTGPKTTLEADLATLRKEKADGKPVEAKLEESLTALETWWQTQGLPNFAADRPKIDEAKLYGAKQALLYTAAVPAALAVGFLLLLLYFAATGGYKQVHLVGEPEATPL